MFMFVCKLVGDFLALHLALKDRGEKCIIEQIKRICASLQDDTKDCCSGHIFMRILCAKAHSLGSLCMHMCDAACSSGQYK